MWSLAALSLVASACSSSSAALPGGTPAPTGSPLSLPALKLAVLKAVGGHLDYCDPDQFPVAHLSDADAAKARFETIKADRAAYLAILAAEGLHEGATFTDPQLIAINSDYKQIQAISLNPTDDGDAFRLLVLDRTAPTGNQRVSGIVSRSGRVRITGRGPGEGVNCPICLAAGVLISTPEGPVPVQDIMPGMPVWTVDVNGRPVLATVLRVGSTAAPIGHQVVRLRLVDGRTVQASPGHPTSDGRTLGELRPGDRYDGSVVASAILTPYTGAATFDLLPSGPTGDYFAGGVLLRSTLSPSRTIVSG